jgi:hypothetical protein
MLLDPWKLVIMHIFNLKTCSISQLCESLWFSTTNLEHFHT